MKNIPVLILLVISINSFSQSAIKLTKGEKGISTKNVYINLYRNENVLIKRLKSNEQGFISLRNIDLDTMDKVKINFMKSRYNPIWEQINLKDKDTLEVSLSFNPNFDLPASDLFTKKCTYRSFVRYFPRQPRSLMEIPQQIADSVTKYLQNRVAEKYSYFEFIDGQIVDLDELKSKSDFHDENKTSYYLCFAYKNIREGISIYSSTIELDENGNILKGIEFPTITENSIQEHIIPFFRIKQIVDKTGFLKENVTEVQLEFDSQNNILKWIFVNEKYLGRGFSLREKKIYNAHTGEFLDYRKSTFEQVE
ncbi:MAG: hypothetical protein R3353_02040 [Salegentibacter mishustinae]|nr:hypothetical protein [Salegentibacter mishustinae]